MTKKTVGVVLSGCGFLDGAEIHEATLTLLSLDRRGVKVVPLAPDVEQMHVVDHVKKAPVEGRRRVMQEAARITRGDIRDLATVKASELDALIFPGGYGAAKNLCTWAVDGVGMKVNGDVERLIREMHAAKKPLGFICIAPVIAARVLGHGVRLTVGDAADDAAKGIEAFGARHVARAVEEIEVDPAFKVVSTPAYMLGPSIAPVSQGIDRLVGAVLELA
ncbi:MAG: isoprenoid biosynthesis glyoxalase ElbB [Myxococcota bacterium]|jgi:enhancing lycopene biosynthesis protein 2